MARFSRTPEVAVIVKRYQMPEMTLFSDEYVRNYSLDPRRSETYR